MKRNIIIMLLSAILITACDDKLDIVPKGNTTLTSAADLETLLCQVYTCYEGAKDLETLANNSYPSTVTLAQMLSETNTPRYALLTYDETIDRADLTVSEYRYDELYKYINYMNVIIAKIGDADGEASLKARVAAEAHLIRAWLHFLSVNIYAKQYDEASADKEGGVPFVDNINVEELKAKKSVAEVYRKILADCDDDYIAAMRQNAVNNPFRVEADFGYAVKALVLFQMKRYDEALAYAQRALAINSNIEDRTQMLTTGKWELPLDADNCYFMVRGTNTNLGPLTNLILTPEATSLIDPNDCLWSVAKGYQEYAAFGLANVVRYRASNVHIPVYGIRTENMMYTAAECLIRQGKYVEGLQMVDQVRKYRLSSFEPFAERSDINSESAAMKLLQDAKRIEMLGSCYNYLDMKRWNSESAYKRTLTRDLGEAGTRKLTPESPLWVFPFPQESALLNPTLTPNY